MVTYDLETGIGPLRTYVYRRTAPVPVPVLYYRELKRSRHRRITVTAERALGHTIRPYLLGSPVTSGHAMWSVPNMVTDGRNYKLVAERAHKNARRLRAAGVLASYF